MKKQSTFTIEGSPTVVNIESPDNLVDAIGAERSNELLRSFGHAHWVQSAIKSAFGKPSAKLTDEDRRIIQAVNDGRPLNFMDYVPDERGTAPTQSDLDISKKAWAALQKGDISHEQLAASYKKVNLEYIQQPDEAKFVAMHSAKKRTERKMLKDQLA